MAGYFSEAQFDQNDIYSGAMMAIRIPFTTDDSDGTVDDKSFVFPFGAFLADVDFLVDGTDTMTASIVVKTVDGVIAHPNDTISLEEGKRYILNDRPSLIGGFMLSLTNAGSSDADKSGTIILNLASNKR